MDRVSSIFARFDPANSSRVLTSNVISHVLPRAFVGGGGVFSDTAKIPPLRATLRPSITKTQTSPSSSTHEPIAPMEVSLSRRKNDAAVYTSRSASPVSYETRVPPQPAPTEEPVRSVASSSLTLPHPKRASRTVPSVKTIQSTVPGAPKPKRKRIRIKTPRRREQCRTNQARYRQKQTQFLNIIFSYENDPSKDRDVDLLDVLAREYLKNAPKMIMEQAKAAADSSDSDSDSSDSSSSSGSSSDSDSDSSDSCSD
ncbi:hypothetical protein PC113_g18324 [Phytophthora cactorum]|uniref:Uncharacterized protein n=1 Tax=Phytophthora cactorum TaxID=29920 RepID=A0A8T0YJT9_9STRA|nr:hypothetical protein PC113_g18324 [Phytophthora cactorum]